MDSVVHHVCKWFTVVFNGRILEKKGPGVTPLVLGTEEASSRRETKKKCHKGTVRMGITRHLKL